MQLKLLKLCLPPSFCHSGMMDLSSMKLLPNDISCFYDLSSTGQIDFEPVQNYYQKAEEVLKLLKPVVDAIIDAEVASNEPLQKAISGLSQSVGLLRRLYGNCHSLMSKVYFVFEAESLIEKALNAGLEILELLKSFDGLPVQISASSLENCQGKLKHNGHGQISSIIISAIRDLVEGSTPSSESLAKIGDLLRLRSNLELLIEAVALENLKENAELDENNEEVEYIGQMTTLVTHMHDNLVRKKQSKRCSPVQIPADFCCPLSLELMTDPVIVSSGQTYERIFIQKWIDLGLTVCPKSRQTLFPTNLIPNFNLKALIAGWCESNNVKMPDPVKSKSSNEPCFFTKNTEPGAPVDSLVRSHSRGNQPVSADFAWSLDSAGEKSLCSEIHQDGISRSHTRSSSEGSLCGLAVNKDRLNIDRLQITSSNGRLVKSVERSLDSGGQDAMLPSIQEVSSAFRTDKRVFCALDQNTSASRTVFNSEFSEGTPDNRNEASSQFTECSIDATWQRISGHKPDTNMSSPLIDPEVPSVSETQSSIQRILFRPSEQFVPRIVSSPATKTRADLSETESQVQRLVEDLRSNSLDAQRNATAELRLLSKHSTENRIVIANTGALSLLVDLLHSADTQIQETAVTAILNLSINANNRTAIVNGGAIEPLIHVLQTGSPEARENSAATLYSLSVIQDNRIKIGKSGAIKPLVDLLRDGTPRGKKDATTALFNLSLFHENKAPTVQAGAIKYLVELLDPAAGMVDKAVAVLSNLSTIPEGKVAIGQEGAVPLLVEVLELGSARGKENAAAALLQLCKASTKFSNTVLHEGAIPPLVLLSKSGTARAREKAQELLSHFRMQQHGNATRAKFN